jgi:hypothetical protein
MIYEADPNGHGFISDKAFEKIIANFKLQKEEKVINPISTQSTMKVWLLMKF